NATALAHANNHSRLFRCEANETSEGNASDARGEDAHHTHEARGNETRGNETAENDTGVARGSDEACAHASSNATFHADNETREGNATDNETSEPSCAQTFPGGGPASHDDGRGESTNGTRGGHDGDGSDGP
ncbi:MAG: hypothetical protein ACYDCK_14945, partial [Thermoplasmatota archaeon]